MTSPIEKDVVLKRVNGIQKELTELRALAELPPKEFSEGIGFKLSQYHLHRALEGIFNIGSIYFHVYQEDKQPSIVRSR